MNATAPPDRGRADAATPKRAVTPKRATPTRRRTQVVIALIGSCVMAFVLFLIIRIQGPVAGREFNPDDFRQREFSFYEIPLLRLQITPIRRRNSNSETAQFLRRNSLIDPRSGETNRWDLVEITRGISGEIPADARLLVEQLSLRRDGDGYWQIWSQRHPEHARRLWPVVQRLSRRELYLLLPPLFEMAQNEGTADELSEAIRQYLRQQYSDLIADMREAGREELAEALLREATEDFPDDPRWPPTDRPD